MTTLEDLFYINIVHAENGVNQGSEYSKLLNLAVWKEEKLSVTLTKEPNLLFDKYKDCTILMYGISEKEEIVDGVKLGVKIVSESFSGYSPNFKEI